MSGKSLKILLILAVLSAGAGASYWWLHQRQRLPETAKPGAQGAGLSADGVAMQNAEERKRLEETLKTVRDTDLLNQQNRNSMPGAQNQNPNSDIMNTLKSIEDINRINQMNRESQKKSPLPPQPATQTR